MTDLKHYTGKTIDFTTSYLQLKNLYNKDFMYWLDLNTNTAYCGKVEYKGKICSALDLFECYENDSETFNCL